jgi:hypothetical protein
LIWHSFTINAPYDINLNVGQNKNGQHVVIPKGW